MAKKKRETEIPLREGVREGMPRLEQVNGLIMSFGVLCNGYPNVDVINALMLFTAQVLTSQTQDEHMGKMVDRYTDFLTERVAEMTAGARSKTKGGASHGKD
jgi:hypothetical protein